MEAITPHAFLVKSARQGESVVHPGVGAMESRVETGDLQRVRKGGACGHDARKVMRLVQRRQRDELLKLRDDLFAENCRLGETRSAMQDAMSNGANMKIGVLRFQRLDDVDERHFMLSGRMLRKRLVFDDLPAARLEDAMRGGAKIFDLPARLEPRAGLVHLEQREFKRGRSGIDGQNVRRHASSEQRAPKRRRVRKNATAQEANEASRNCLPTSPHAIIGNCEAPR